MIVGDIFGFLGLITFIYLYFYITWKSTRSKVKYDNSSRGDYSSFNNKKENSSINDFKDRYEDARKFVKDNYDESYENAREFVEGNYEDAKKDIEKSFKKHKEVLEFFNKNEKKITRNNSQKTEKKLKK